MLETLFCWVWSTGGATPLLWHIEQVRSPGPSESYYIQIDPQLLENESNEMQLDFGDHLTVFFRQSGSNRGGHILWVGDNGWGEQAILTFKNGWASGLIYDRDQVWTLAPDPTGQILERVEPGDFLPCAGGISIDPTVEKATPGCTDDGSQIDVLVVFTPQVRDALGGLAQAEAFAQSAVDITNTAWQNSQIIPTMRLVGAALVSHNDSGNTGDDLVWVRTSSEVANLRNSVGADMTCLLVNDASDACGRGYVQNNPSSNFASSAFQVTARNCAIGNLSFAHEFGHNQGCEHNPENSGHWPNAGSFPWAYGHWNNGSYRTVMSYSNPCSSGCTRRPYFSNSQILFSGLPTGVLDERENYRTINATALIVANFRKSICNTSAYFGDWPAINISQLVSSLAGCCP